MTNKRAGLISGFLVAGGATVALALSPTAAAEPGLNPSCVETDQGAGGIEGGGTTVCESPGNAEITSHPAYIPPTGAMGGMGMFPWGDGMFML